jgi:hypothetical protein
VSSSSRAKKFFTRVSRKRRAPFTVNVFLEETVLGNSKERDSKLDSKIRDTSMFDLQEEIIMS